MRFLTTKMKDRLQAELDDTEKHKQRDIFNSLLAYNINAVVSTQALMR